MAADELRGDSLKQRLVGGIALLVIGVIAWFWLLSADSPVDPVSRATQIPPAPAIEPFTVPEPTPPAAVAPIGSERDSQPTLRAPIADESRTGAETANSAAVVPVPVTKAAPATAPASTRPAPMAKTALEKKPAPAEKAPPAQPKETFAIDQHGLPVAWVVQVGLFSTQAGADKVKAALQGKGFKAYTEPYKTASAPQGVKVFVGPKLSRERADEQKRAIDAALKVNSKVVRFQAPQR